MGRKTKTNVIANYIGQGWSSLLTFAFIPLYIRYIGMESYGLIGLFSVIEAWLSLLDMGMTPTLNREMARFTAGMHTPQSIRDLLRSVEILTYSLALLIGLGIWSTSGYLATGWLKVQHLSISSVSNALSFMAVVVALRFCETIYRSSLFGLQRQILYNGLFAALATLRFGGAVLVLALVSPTIQAFFVWQALISLLTVATLAAGVHWLLPAAPAAARFSRSALAGVWRFAGGNMGITALSLILTQVDKVFLSRLLPLDFFGHYVLAATVASVLLMVIAPLNNGLYPRMVELTASGMERDLIGVYHHGSQLITVLTAPAALLLNSFAAGVIFMWSGDMSLAQHVGPILSVFAIGTFLNALMNMPYQLQLAHGWTGLIIKSNIVAVSLLIPSLFWAVPRYGALGAAWLWVALNSGYVLISIQCMHRRLIPKEKWRWYLSDVLLPVSGSAGVLLVAKFFEPAMYQSRVSWFVFLLISGSAATAVSVAITESTRSQVLRLIQRSLQWEYS
jgi:O-antigen/teichoic acid export membrane protein